MENYFNYFTEIEEHFQKCRGKIQPLSPLDWSLIESLQEVGIPLKIVLRGIDMAFERHSKNKGRTRKINSLSYCTQTIIAEHEKQKLNDQGKIESPKLIESTELTDRQNLSELLAKSRQDLTVLVSNPKYSNERRFIKVLKEVTASIESIILEVKNESSINYEELELRLSTLEDRIMASIFSLMSEKTAFELKKEICQEISRHKRTLNPEYIVMLENKMMRKKMLESFSIPRLSLFYLPMN